MSSHYSEEEVVAVAKLEKTAVLIGTGMLEDARDLWANDPDELEPREIFARMEKVLHWLQEHGYRKIANVSVASLREAIAGWEQTGFEVYNT